MRLALLNKKPAKKWIAFISLGGKKMNLGTYLTKEEAIKVRDDAEKSSFIMPTAKKEVRYVRINFAN
jgi:hypothetical protein